MPAARYWRIARIETYQLGDLALSEIALHDSGGRVDSEATVTVNIEPTTGSLSLMGDGSFAAAATWTAMPAFTYDFGSGVTKDIIKAGVAGPSRDTFAHRFSVEYSTDGVTFTTLFYPAVGSKWPGASSYYELDAAQSVDTFPGVLYLTSSSPYSGLYKRDGDSFSALPFPAIPGSPNALTISPDGSLAAVCISGGNGLRLFSRKAYEFAGPLDVSSTSMDNPRAVAFSSDGLYMSVASFASPYIFLYKNVDGTYVRLSNPASLPSSQQYACSCTPDGVYLAVAGQSPSTLVLYKRTGDTYAKLTDPAVVPSAVGRSCSFSPDGIYLAVAVDNSTQQLLVYKRTGDTFTSLTLPAPASSANGQVVAFSPSGEYLALATSSGTDRFRIFKRSGDTFTLIQTLNLAASGSTAISWSPDSTYLAVSYGFSGTGFDIYKRTGDTFNVLTRPSDLPGASPPVAVAFLPFDNYGGGMLPANYDATPLRFGSVQTVTTLGDEAIGDTTTLTMPAEIQRDMEDFGFGRIAATVKEKSTPTNLPLARRVRLMHERSGRVVRETISDPVTGNYSFDNLDMTQVYYVEAFDHTNVYRAVIADKLVPEPMP